MDHFTNTQFQSNDFNYGQSQINVQQNRNPQGQPPRIASFKDEYQGIIHGLNSSIQLGFTGISMLQFFMTMKTVTKSVKEFIKPKVRYGLSKIDLKLLGIKVLILLERLFKIKNTKDAVIKGIIVSLIYIIIKVICWFFEKKQKLTKQKFENNKNEKLIEKTSEEFNLIKKIPEAKNLFNVY